MAVRKAGAGEAWGAWAQACSSEIEPVGVLEACMKSPMNLTASSRIDRSLRARSSRCELPAELPATAPPFSWDDTAGGASASGGVGREGACDARAREAARRSREAGRREGARWAGRTFPLLSSSASSTTSGLAPGAAHSASSLATHPGRCIMPHQVYRPDAPFSTTSSDSSTLTMSSARVRGEGVTGPKPRSPHGQVRRTDPAAADAK